MSLLRHNSGFRSLVAARVVSFAGDSLGLVALMLYVAETTGQGLAVSLLLLAGDFTPSLLSPLTGAVSDRFDLRRVMVACELVQGALVVAIAVTLPPLPVLLVLVAARSVAAHVFQPASRSAVPALVADPELPKANSTLGFATNGGEVSGPLLAAALLPFVGIKGVLLLDAATFLGSALILIRLPKLPAVPGDHPSLLRQATAGLGYLRSAPAVRIIVLGFCAVVMCTAIDDVALVLLAKETLHSGDAAVGLLLSAVGIGLLCGYGVVARLGARVPLAVLLAVGFAVTSLGNLLTGLAWAVGAAFAMQATRGLGIAAIDVASNTLLQRLVPPEFLGRVFGNLYGGIGIAAAISYVGGGLLLDATSPRVTFVLAGAGGVLVAAVVAVTLPRALREQR